MDHVIVDLTGHADEDVVLLIVHAHEVVELLLEGGVEVVKALEVLHLAGLGAKLLAGLTHDAVVHHDIQHLGHDEHAQGVDPGLAGQVQVQAAGQGVVPGLLQRHALVHQALDVALVGDEGGHAQTGLYQLQGLFHQRLGGAFVDPQGDGEVGGAHLVGGLQHQIGELVGGVVAVLVHAADDKVVPPGHTGPLVTLLGVAGDEVELHDLDAQALDELQDVGVGHGAALDVLLVEGVHILVEAAAGHGAVGDHHPVEPEVLDGIPEVAGGVLGDPVAGLGHLLQLSLPLGVGTAVGGLGTGVAVTVVHADHGLQGNDDGLEIDGLVEGIVVHIADLAQLLLGVVQGLVDALADDLAVVGHEEAQADAQAPAEAGAAGAAALDLAGPGGAKDAGADEGPQVLIIVEAALPLVHLTVLTLPEGVQAAQGGPILVGDGVVALQDGVQIVVIPEGTPAGGLQAVGFGGHVAHDELVLVHIDGAVVQIVGGGVGAPQDGGKALVLLPGLDHQLGLLRAEDKFVRLQRRLHSLDSVSHNGPPILCQCVYCLFQSREKRSFTSSSSSRRPMSR